MALVDDVKIKVISGNGGDGSNAFSSVSGNPKKFSDGGNGGRGADIYFQASNNVSDLSQFRFQKEVKAENGEDGSVKNCTGRSGKDTVILVPPGTKIIDEETKEVVEIMDINIPILIASGGHGGQGSHNYKPNIKKFHPQYKEGGKGETKNLHLILSLIADVGLIGFPNAGKSSLLMVLTNATPKIGNYPFTTLEPNLGAMKKIIIADIPGLLEGASKGIGLGTEFLKHIEKTKILMHCIDATEKDPVRTYKTVRKEFEEYNLSLLEKEEIILLTKKDLISEEEMNIQIKLLKKFKRKIIPMSIYDEKSINDLKIFIENLAEKF